MTSFRSPRLLRTWSAAVAAGALTLTCAVTTAAHASPAPDRDPQVASAAVRIAVLPTGERIALTRHDGHTSARLLSSPDPAASGGLSIRRAAGHTYVFSAVAEHYLGILDPSLFDVSTLPAPGGRTDVRLSGATSVVPGVRGTDRADGTGYLTTTSAAEFGRALAAAWRHDAACGRRTAPFGLHSISAPRPAPTVRATADGDMVTVALLGLDGKPVDGAIGIQDDDDSRRYSRYVPTTNGQAKVTVPAGHYSLIADYTTQDPATGNRDIYRALVHDYVVRANGQRVVLDLRKATAQVQARTPRPATLESGGVDFELLDRENHLQGLGISDLTGFGAGDRVFVTPTPEQRVGVTHLATTFHLAGLSGTGTPYTYDLGFDHSHGVPASLTDRAQNTTLATIDARYYDATEQSGSFDRSGSFAFEIFTVSDAHPLSLPTQRTEYVGAVPGLSWGAELDPDAHSDEFVASFDHHYVAGQRLREDWLRGPLGPGFAQGTLAPNCSVCRRPHNLSVLLPGVTDTAGDHFGAPQTVHIHPSTRVQFYRDGTVIDDQTNSDFVTGRVPDGEHEYRVLGTLTRPGAISSTRATTDVHFRSSDSDGAALPRGWHCLGQRLPDGNCTIPSVLTGRVELPTNLSDSLPAGNTKVVFTVGHIGGAHASAITSAVLSTSVDGVHFTPAKVTALGDGRYQAVLVTPAAARGKGVSVRLAATDAAGGSYVQTVTDAYLVPSG